MYKRQVYLTQIRGMLGTMTAEYEAPTYLYILIQAGALLCIFPLLLLFLFGQRFFTESIERTGIVGSPGIPGFIEYGDWEVKT